MLDVPNLFEPVGTFGILTQCVRYSLKMAVTGDRVSHRMAVAACLQLHSEDPYAVVVVATKGAFKKYS